MRAALPILLVALTLVACGGGKSPGTAVGRTPSSVATADATGPTFTGQGSAEYCRLSRSFGDALDKLGQPGSPDELRAYYRQVADSVQQSVKVAPPEIKSDVQVIADTLTALVNALDKINFDTNRIRELPASLINQVQQADASFSRAADYEHQFCG